MLIIAKYWQSRSGRKCQDFVSTTSKIIPGVALQQPYNYETLLTRAESDQSMYILKLGSWVVIHWIKIHIRSPISLSSFEFLSGTHHHVLNQFNPNFVYPWHIYVSSRAGKSKSLIRWKRLIGGKRRKRRIWFTIRLLAKKYLISGDVLNPESKGSALESQ